MQTVFSQGKSKAEKRAEEMKNEVSRMEEPAIRTLEPGNSTNKNLFGKSLRSDNERLDRLERAVQELRNDFDTVSPSIKRLMAIEADIQELIGELRQLSSQPAMAAPPPRVNRAPEIIRTQKPAIQRTAKPVSPKSFQTKSAPPVQNGMATVFDLRTGEHPGKTRLVMDVNTKASFSVDIDNGENIMVIEIPNANWTARTTGSLPKSKVIQSYSVETNDNGALLIAQLKRNARIAYKDDLPSNKGNGRRIVIDVSPQ